MALPAAADVTADDAPSAAIACKYFLRFIAISPLQPDREILSQLGAAVSARRPSPGAADVAPEYRPDRSTAPPTLHRPLRSGRTRPASSPAQRRPLPAPV